MKPSEFPAPRLPQSRARCLPAGSFSSPPPSPVSASAALVVTPGFNLSGGYPAALAQNLREQAHKLQAPVGFADIVEKVKPAVISVRVKIDGGRRDQHGLGRRDAVPPGLA